MTHPRTQRPLELLQPPLCIAPGHSKSGRRLVQNSQGGILRLSSGGRPCAESPKQCHCKAVQRQTGFGWRGQSHTLYVKYRGMLCLCLCLWLCSMLCLCLCCGCEACAVLSHLVRTDRAELASPQNHVPYPLLVRLRHWCPTHTHTAHSTHNTQHTAHSTQSTQHTAHNTQHTTHNTQHTQHTTHTTQSDDTERVSHGGGRAPAACAREWRGRGTGSASAHVPASVLGWPGHSGSQHG